MKSQEVKELSPKYRTNITEYDDEKYIYLVREFKLGQVISIKRFAFRLGLGQPSVNFPPLTKKVFI